MASDGIRVQNAGVLTIGQGVTSTGNGVAGNNTAADGLHVLDQGKASIDVTSGDPVHLDGNTAHGIFVTGTGSGTVNGTPGTGGAGTITTNSNTLAGGGIQQEPGRTPPVNTTPGLAARANTGNGIRVVGRSALPLCTRYALPDPANRVA